VILSPITPKKLLLPPRQLLPHLRHFPSERFPRRPLQKIFMKKYCQIWLQLRTSPALSCDCGFPGLARTWSQFGCTKTANYKAHKIRTSSIPAVPIQLFVFHHLKFSDLILFIQPSIFTPQDGTLHLVKLTTCCPHHNPLCSFFNLNVSQIMKNPRKRFSRSTFSLLMYFLLILLKS
jgi:hypothetical protein